MSEETTEDLYQVSILDKSEILLEPTNFMAIDKEDAKTQAIGHYARLNPEAPLKGIRVRVRPF